MAIQHGRTPIDLAQWQRRRDIFEALSTAMAG
jgi:hypothetical protein